MSEKLNFHALANDAGIVYQTGFQPRELDNVARATVANDADLITAPNAGILAMFTTYVDPRVIEIAVEPMKAAQIFGETKKGTWVDDNLQFPIAESTGEVSSYDDFGTNGMSGANVNWENRQPYHYQTIVEVGEREVERAGAAKLDWVARKQIAAALVLNKFQNKSYFFGVSGLANYGILNDPSLSASLPGSDWDALTADQVFASIQGALYGRLIGQTKGLIDRDFAGVLLLSPQNEVNLLKTNQYNVNVVDQLKKNFPNMRIETAPEMSTAAGELVYLIVEEYEGVRTIEPTFTEKMRVHPMVLGLSSWQQKRSQGTVGAIIYRPLMVASLILT
jgi:hypothetical protein